MRRVSAANLVTPFESGLHAVVAQHRTLSAPVTDLLAVVVCAVYAGQAFQAALWDVPSVFVATNYAYLRTPWLAWPLSPLLHGGLVHVVPNLLTLLAVGRIAEDHLTTRRFAAMAGLAAVGSIAALAGWGLAFGSRPYVAAYGISGVVFAAGGFAVGHLPGHHRVTDLELLAILFGVCAVGLVGADILAAAVLGAPAGVNVGHAVGLLVGLGTAAVVRDCADVRVVGSASRTDPDPAPQRSEGDEGPVADGWGRRDAAGRAPGDGSDDDA